MDSCYVCKDLQKELHRDGERFKFAFKITEVKQYSPADTVVLFIAINASTAPFNLFSTLCFYGVINNEYSVMV